MIAAVGGIPNEGLSLDEPQKRQLDSSIKKAKRDLIESVWRTYKNVMLLGRDNTLEKVDLGLVTSSSAESLSKLILSEMRRKDIVAKEVPPRFLVRNWPPFLLSGVQKILVMHSLRPRNFHVCLTKIRSRIRLRMA